MSSYILYLDFLVVIPDLVKVLKLWYLKIDKYHHCVLLDYILMLERCSSEVF